MRWSRQPSETHPTNLFLRGLGWATWGGYLGWLAFGLLWHHDPTAQSTRDGWLAFAALCSRAFVFHLGVIVIALVIVALIVRARRLAVLSALLLLPTLGSRLGSVVPGASAPQVTGGEGLTVFSANMLFGHDRLGALMPQIEASDADLVLLQEYEASGSESEDFLRALYPYHASWPREEAFGQAVFSRHPFVQTPRLEGGPEGTLIPAVVCVVEVGSRAVTVLNVHPLPPVGAERTLGQRAMVCWIAERAGELAGDLGAGDGLIVAGDFNAPFHTSHLRELRHAGLRESHNEIGAGFGATWPRVGWERHFPGIRLDHIMFIGALEPVWAGVGSDFGSDHRPVVARFEWAPAEP